jgi:hypothetical protein
VKTIPFLIASGLIITACAPTIPLEVYESAVATSEAIRKGAASFGATATSQLATVQANLSTMDATQAALETEIEDTTRERNEAIRQNTTTSLQLEKHICEESLTGMDYSSIANASAILMGFVAQQPWAERTQGTFRDSIWNNVDTKIHGVRYIGSRDHQPYVTYFMVYFPELTWKRGVYWLDRQCWLDRP